MKLKNLCIIFVMTFILTMTVACNHQSYSELVLTEFDIQGYAYYKQSEAYVADMIDRHDEFSELINVYNIVNKEDSHITATIWEFSSASATEEFASLYSCIIEDRGCTYQNIFVFSSSSEVFDLIEQLDFE